MQMENQSTHYPMDTVKDKIRKRWMTFRINECFLPKIEDLQRDYCPGCECDHPSQKYHSCLGIGVNSTGQASHPVDDYLYDALEEKPKDEDIDRILGSFIEDPRGHVTLWESEDRWIEEVETELRKFWKVPVGLRMILRQ